MKKKLFWLILFICLFGFIGKAEAWDTCFINITNNHGSGQGRFQSPPNRAVFNNRTKQVCIHRRVNMLIDYWDRDEKCQNFTAGSVMTFEFQQGHRVIRMNNWDAEQVFSRIENQQQCPRLYINLVNCNPPQMGGPNASDTCFYRLEVIDRKNLDPNIPIGEITGATFHELICQLHPYLARLASRNGKSITQTLTIDDEEKGFGAWGCPSTTSCQGAECENNLEHEVERRIKNIANYCNRTYSRFSIHREHDFFLTRTKECISFDNFYSHLASQGIIRDLSENCGLTNDAIGMINFFLDILMIAGPLIAIGLGIVDFAKAVVATDAPKEMKEAGSRFLKRIIAAIILLIVPILLSFLMNIFLSNQSAYDRENPFCGVGGRPNHNSDSDG